MIGPVEVSVERFWRMVWENQIPTVVMLTQCTEAGKVWYNGNKGSLHLHMLYQFSGEVC